MTPPTPPSERGDDTSRCACEGDHDTPPEEPEQAPEPPELGDDFADEHAGATYAEQLSGGPEGETETETPPGYAGMEARGITRRRRGDRR